MDDIELHIDPELEMNLHKMPAIEVAAFEAATKIADRARDTAPVVTGRYKAGIKVERFRGGARVLATDQKSSWVEFGNPKKHIPAQFILRNAAASLGFKFKKGRGA